MADKFHIGKIIRQCLSEQKRSVAWLAGEIHCDSSNLRKMLKNGNIHDYILKRICRVMRINFYIFLCQNMEEDLRNMAEIG